MPRASAASCTESQVASTPAWCRTRSPAVGVSRRAAQTYGNGRRTRLTDVVHRRLHLRQVPTPLPSGLTPQISQLDSVPPAGTPPPTSQSSLSPLPPLRESTPALPRRKSLPASPLMTSTPSLPIRR